MYKIYIYIFSFSILSAQASFNITNLSTNADKAYDVTFADIDNDGDLDIISASYEDDKIAWYENNGAADPSFSATTISTSADGATSVFVADIDNDGDMDIVSASEVDDKIAWYENNGAAGPSFSATTITIPTLSIPLLRSVLICRSWEMCV